MCLAIIIRMNVKAGAADERWLLASRIFNAKTCESQFTLEQ